MLILHQGQARFTALIFIRVSPERQRRVLELNVRDTKEKFQDKPGMIAVAFHRSLDGEQVAELIQWESAEHLQAALKATEIDEHIGDVRQEADGDEFLPCTPRYVYTAGQASDAIPTVSPRADALTVIVRLETNPSRQQILSDLLVQDVEAPRTALPGLISVSLLTSPDGNNTVTYWQFKNQAAFTALQPEFERSITEKFGSLICASDVRLYETGPILSGTASETETLAEAVNTHHAKKTFTGG